MDRRTKLQLWAFFLAVAMAVSGSYASVWKMSASLTAAITRIASRQETDSTRIDKLEKDGSQAVQSHIALDDQRFKDLKDEVERMRKQLEEVPTDIKWIKKSLEGHIKP